MKHLIVLFGILWVSLFINSCAKEAKGTDEELLELAKGNGFVWYKNADSLLDKSSASGHSELFLRTRFNNIAASVLDSAGKVKVGVKFPDGSLIVKELFKDKHTFSLYAILYKKNGHKHADADGWVWGYIYSDGKVKTSAKKKGESCRGCHSASNNIDFTLMNKYFP